MTDYNTLNTQLRALKRRNENSGVELVPDFVDLDMEELARVIGKTSMVAAVAVTDEKLAEKILEISSKT